MVPREYLTAAQTAERLGCSIHTLEGWRRRGEGPPFHRLGRLIRYSIADLQAWEESCREGAA